MDLTVCSCHVTYKFQSKSTVYCCLNVKQLLARSRHEIWRLSDYNCIRTQNHLPIWPIWPNDWAVFWVHICMVNMPVCFCHVTYAFQSKSTLYSCLNLKELLAWNKREIWKLSDCGWTRTINHLVYKRRHNQFFKLAKWCRCVLSIYLYGRFDNIFFSCHVHVSD